MVKRVLGLGIGCFGLLACGAASHQEEKATTTTPEAANQEAAAIMANTDSGAIPAEKFEEIDAFFHRKAQQLQFECYNAEVEKTHQKYQGKVNLMLVVIPGGKLREVKITASSLKSPGIEECILAKAKEWSWPEVPAAAPYQGEIAFKPAW
jgi:hypothetical protein